MLQGLLFGLHKRPMLVLQRELGYKSTVTSAYQSVMIISPTFYWAYSDVDSPIDVVRHTFDEDS